MFKSAENDLSSKFSYLENGNSDIPIRGMLLSLCLFWSVAFIDEHYCGLLLVSTTHLSIVYHDGGGGGGGNAARTTADRNTRSQA